jgi:hypothetical protein
VEHSYRSQSGTRVPGLDIARTVLARPLRELVECSVDLFNAARQQMSVAVEHDDRAVAGASGDLGGRGTGGDRERNGIAPTRIRRAGDSRQPDVAAASLLPATNPRVNGFSIGTVDLDIPGPGASQYCSELQVLKPSSRS